MSAVKPLPRKRADLLVLSSADAPHLKKAALAIEQAAWKEAGYLNFTRAHYKHYECLLDHYPEYQLYLVDEESGYPFAVAHSVPFACSNLNNLPAEGWDWLVETAACTKSERHNNTRRAGDFRSCRSPHEGIWPTPYSGAWRACEG